MTKTETYIDRARRALDDPFGLEDLVDIGRVRIDPDAPPEERIRQLVKQVRNPYRFLVGDIVVKTEFAGEKTLEECMRHYLDNFEAGGLADAVPMVSTEGGKAPKGRRSA